MLQQQSSESGDLLMSNFNPRLVKRIRTGKAFEPSDALDALVRDGHASNPELVAAVEEHIRDGRDLLLDEVLVRWIIAAAPTSTGVFNARWPRLRRNADAVLALYRSKAVALSEVERQVLDFLDEFGSLPGQPYRPMFLDAVRDYGSERCTLWLEAFLAELKAQAALRRDLAAAIPDYERALVAAALGESLTKCAEAIAAIELRRLVRGDRDANIVAAPGFGVGTSRYAATHLADARQAAAGSSPGACLNKLRMFAEALCNDLYVRWKIGQKPPELLGDKLKALKETLKSKDQWLQVRLWGLKQLVDFGSHHSEAFVDRLTVIEVQLALDLAEGINRAYLILE